MFCSRSILGRAVAFKNRTHPIFCCNLRKRWNRYPGRCANIRVARGWGSEMNCFKMNAGFLGPFSGLRVHRGGYHWNHTCYSQLSYFRAFIRITVTVMIFPGIN